MTNDSSARKSKIQRISDCYTIKSNGTVSLDLAKAAKSEVFKESIRRLIQINLPLDVKTK